jgi:hypothetical protein
MVDREEYDEETTETEYDEINKLSWYLLEKNKNVRRIKIKNRNPFKWIL